MLTCGVRVTRKVGGTNPPACSTRRIRVCGSVEWPMACEAAGVALAPGLGEPLGPGVPLPPEVHPARAITRRRGRARWAVGAEPRGRVSMERRTAGRAARFPSRSTYFDIRGE